MQALILAAGMGKRLGELTKNNTKCMLPVNGVRLIDRFITQLSKYSLKKLIIVVGYEGQKLIDYIGHRYDDILKIECITNPIYDKTNNIYSLALAKDELCKDDTILLESDLIFEDQILDMLIEHPDKDLALVAKYETWMDGTMVRIDNERNIVNFVPKEAFRYEDVDVYYKTVNIYKFSKEFSSNFYVPFLEAYSKVMGNNEYYEQVLRVLLHLHNSPLKALPIGSEKWYEIDDVQDLDIASTIFSSGETKYHEYHKRYGGYWRFPQMLDYCYLVNPFFPTKRMKDELKANFDVLLENYPSGMFVNSLLAGKYFGIKQDYVVVGNGAAELIKVVMEQHSEDKVGIIYPTFDEYPNRLKKEQIVPFIVNSKDFRYSASDLISYFGNKDIRLLLLINPDNPSGNFIPKNDLLGLAEWCDCKGIKLVVDESFVDFTEDFEHNSLLHNDILEKYPSLMVMKSISKSYGVPGLRLGVFVSSNRDLIAKMKKEVSIWNINSFAEFYLQIFGKYEKDYKKACTLFIKEREVFKSELESIPFLHVMPSQANYFLCEVTQKYTSAELTQKLIDANIIISNCGLKSNMQGKQLIRLAIRSREDNDKLIQTLKRL
ncbi:MAG: aminotransferase class I/II-fold pyridoxal phosphate-dependent enzyme [Paludibacteraceae bacterium]|nr:aminotransferase class I/II-fold pyridoxal phosphate-dependent enzyme [Paludibacteraceae bacterium]